MDLMNNILALQDELFSFWLNEINLLLALIIFAAIFLSSLMATVSEKNGAKVRTRVIISLIAISVIGIATTNIIKHSIEKELTGLEQKYFSSLEYKIVDVETNLIVHSEVASKNLCPHVKLKDNTKCFFIKFATNDGVKQLFLPSNYSETNNSNTVVKIPYYDLKDQDREFLIEYLELDSQRIKRNYDVDLEKWSLGFEIE